MRKILVFSLVLFTFSQAFADFYVWKGFSLQWGYNHRLNRLGNYIEQGKGEDAKGNFHFASGLGADTGHYESYYSRVQSDEIQAQQEKISFVLSGKEGKQDIAQRILKFSEGKKDQGVLFINGFDYYSLDQSSDKLVDFKIEINKIKKGKFKLQAKSTMACASLECPFFKNGYKYQLDIYVLYLKIPQRNIIDQETHSTFNQYKWNLRKEPSCSSQVVQSDLNPYQSIQGFTSFSFSLSKQRHFMAWQNYIDHDGKDYEVRQCLYQWQKGIKKGHLLSMKRSGVLKASSEFNIIQVSQANITHSIASGKEYYKGGNQSSFSEDSLHYFNVE